MSTKTKMQTPANVSALPAGLVMADEPLTNRHYVLTDKDNSAPVSEIITRHIREERANMHPDETLVVIMSELHPVSAHILLRASVLADAALYRDESPDDETRKFLYAYELPYNELENLAIEKYHITVPDHLKYHPNIYDPDYNLAMQAIIADNRFLDAPQSTNLLFRMCLQHNIPTCFNDVARNNYVYGIDYNDPLISETFNLFKKISLLQTSTISRSKDSMIIRNSVVAVRAMMEAERIGAKTIIQGTGGNHTLGNKCHKPEAERIGAKTIIQGTGGDHTLGNKCHKPYETSLTLAFYHAGAHKVLPVFLSHSKYKAEDVIHDKALKENPDIIIIDGMQDDKYYDHQTSEELKNIELLAKKWNGNAHTFMPTDPPSSKEEVKKEIEEAFDI